MNYVYILKSRKDGGFYVGCTSDIRRRIHQHNTGKTLSLKNRLPLEIMYVEKYNDPTSAYAREKQIKAYKGGEAFKKLVISQNKGGVA